MKNCVTILLILVVVCHLNAQTSRYWGQLTPGDYKVGYQDTIIFNPGQQYELNDYRGDKPYFVNMWFPLTSETGSRIKYNEYLIFDSIPEIQSLIDSIQKVQHSAFVSWGVTYDLDMWENSPFSKGKQDLTKKMLEENLHVNKTNQYPKKEFPTIIYHHGNGGISFENSVLFEFLASHGFVIISADYHWPGLRLSSYMQKSDLSLEDVDFVTNFSEGLPFTNHQNLRFIGHSWGGGVALRLNQKRNPKFKHYIIFDSTIEKAVLPELAAIHPHFDSLFRNHPNDFKTKCTVITARASYYSEGKKVIQPYPEFLPYQLIDKTEFTFITLKQILNHGSFTNLEVMRAAFLNQFEQSDSETVLDQFVSYQFLVRLAKDLLVGAELEESKILIQEN